MADPASTPAAQSIVAVGSDTLTPTFDQVSTDNDATSPTWLLYRFDATGSTTVDSKNNAACDNLTRPNGSGAGISNVSSSPTFTSGGPGSRLARPDEQRRGRHGPGHHRRGPDQHS
jgi:hypothetical protein